jgi:hypothetical protein
MGKGQSEEKIFSEQLDQMLGGQEIRLTEQAEADLRTALEFARKMTSLRASPSSVFAARLREKLIANLAAQETPKQGWLTRLISQQPIWQAAAGVIIVLIFASILWITGVFDFKPSEITHSPTPVASTSTTTTTTSPQTTSSTTQTAAPTTTMTMTSTTTTQTTKPTVTTPPSTISLPKILVNAATNKTSYLLGEPVIIEVTLQNAGNEFIKIEQYPPILSLMQTETRQPIYTFNAGTGTANLPPNTTTSFQLIWNQQDAGGGTISPGSYYLELEDLDYQGQAVKLTLSQSVQFNVVGY